VPQPPRIHSRFTRFRLLLRELYTGMTPRAVRFRYGVIILDLLIVGFFIAAPLIRGTPSFLILDYLIAAIMAADLIARALTRSRLIEMAKSINVWIDLFVLVTLLFPLTLFNLAFLRILRLWTLVHSEFFWTTVGRRYDDTRWEDVIRAVATMATFIFIVTGFVYTSFVGRHQGIEGYVDALYFTIATLTTTGFGDITLPGAWGRILSVAIMLTGITLFFRLAQVLIRPAKVRFPCPTCGLQRHDLDAVHCKACGEVLNIPDEGD
jgi:voltage-gated potassium channel